MGVTDPGTNELLAKVVERFKIHSKYVKSENPIAAEIAAQICEVELWEMWVLTQKGGRP